MNILASSNCNCLTFGLISELSHCCNTAIRDLIETKATILQWIDSDLLRLSWFDCDWTRTSNIIRTNCYHSRSIIGKDIDDWNTICRSLLRHTFASCDRNSCSNLDIMKLLELVWNKCSSNNKLKLVLISCIDFSQCKCGWMSLGWNSFVEQSKSWFGHVR